MFDIMPRELVGILCANTSILLFIGIWKGSRKYFYVVMTIITLAYVIIEAIDHCIAGTSLADVIGLLSLNIPLIGIGLCNTKESRNTVFYRILWTSILYCVIIMTVKFIISMIK